MTEQGLDEVEAEQRRLIAEIQKAQSEMPSWSSFRLDDKQIKKLIDRVVDMLEHGDKNQSRRALRDFISRIVVEPGKPVAGTIFCSVSEEVRQKVQ